MSAAKRKLANKFLKEKCKSICHIEKGMATKGVTEKFEVLKNNISTWMKNKKKLLSALQETLSSTKRIHSCNYKEVGKEVYD